MKIEWLAHACFLINNDAGQRILTDPYYSGAYGGMIEHEPVKSEVDIVTVSHKHADHAATSELKGKPSIVDTVGEHTIKGVGIIGIKTLHDDLGGAQRGSNIMFEIRTEGVNFLHLGDLGHILTDNQISQIKGDVHVLFCPVGGIATIGPDQAHRTIQQLSPSIVIPMHYKTDKIKFNFKPVDEFLDTTLPVRKLNSSQYILSEEDLISPTEILVFDPSH